MAIYRLHPSGEITPLLVHEKIGKLIRKGYLQRQAVAIAYNEAREDWGTKHESKAMPSWLTMGDRGKNPSRKTNPVSVPRRDRTGKNPYSISEKTAHKLRKAAPKTFMKMTDEEIKKAVKVKVKKRGKNPVTREYHVQTSLDKIHWTLIARFKNKLQAFEYAKALHKKQPFNYVRVRT